MKSRTWLVFVGVLLALLLLAGTCSAGFVAGRLLPSTAGETALPPANIDTGSLEATPDTVTGSQSDLELLFEPFWQAWQLVHEQYVDQPVDDQALMRGAIRGMLDSLGDEHTAYMDPEAAKQMNDILEGSSYGGIGAWVDTRGEYLTIISPMPGSPAEKVGLRSGDQIIAIDGVDMTGLDGESVRLKVLGPAGTSFKMTVHREGVPEPLNFELTRANITPPSVQYEMLDGQIAYLRLFDYGSKTPDEVRKALEELMPQKPVGLILDLRNNGGGYVQSCIEITSQFLKEGIILYEEFGDGSRSEYEVEEGGLAVDIPMVVLINEGSASAAEITAGAIQALGRGQLLGVTSFGKGTVQIPTDLKNEAGSVRITIARWLTPAGTTINKIGITPDIVVELTEEDRTAERDPQLDKAVELLTQPK